jgi:HSP20 family protein
MNIARFEPWSFVDQLQRDLSRLVEGRNQPGDSHQSVADWVPPIDILENKESFLLRADVPGVSVDDIDVSMDSGILSVSGERRAEPRDESAGLQHIERATGRFYRRFTLPESVDADGITAKCSNGVLEVVIPKAPAVRARRITIDAA